MSYKPLFEEQISDEDDRLSRLEEAVEALRIDMDMVVAPAVTKLVDDAKAVEAEEPVTDEAPAAAKEEKTAPADKSALPEKSGVAAVAVKGVRIGDHPGMTRVVVDITAKVKPTVAFAHENTQMVVDIGSVAWEAPASFQAETAKMVAAWQFKDGKFMVDLLSPGALKQAVVLDPLPGQTNYRLVLDIIGK